MKIYVKVNRPPRGARCAEHQWERAAYQLEMELFGNKVSRSACALCLCRHFNLQTFFSVEEGLELPKGLRHKR